MTDLEELAAELIRKKRWHELFEARLLAARCHLGVPVVDPPPLEETAEPVRTQLEEAYIEACREVGRHLAREGRYREAWHYLRAAGERAWLQELLAEVTPTRGDAENPDDRGNLEELVEVALYEGVDPPRGYRWVIDFFGTCNAISTLEGIAAQLRPSELEQTAAVLVRHLLDELTGNVRAHIREQEPGSEPTGTLRELLVGRDWLQGGGSHVDASHLAATVRFGRVLKTPEEIDWALQLAEYGEGLHPEMQYKGEPPFEEVYPAHRLFFSACLGRDVDQAIDYFRTQAEGCDMYHEGTGPVETLLVLLDRVGRPGEALKAYAKLVPPGTRLSPYAPRLIDLAMRSREWELYEKMLTERDDRVGLAVARLVRG